MRVFVFEFVTGGGLANEDVAANLVSEGNLIAQAVLNDLTSLPGVEVVTTRDARLPELPAALRGKVDVLAPGESENPIDLYLRGMQSADVVWPIAPEIGGMLDGLTQLASEANKPILSSRTRAVRAATSKLITATALNANGIAAVTTFAETQALPDIAGQWIVKPDDGAGSSRSLILDDVVKCREFLAGHQGWNLVAQPWLAGEPMSLSLLCADGKARLLSVNKQFVSVGTGAPSLDSLFVNAQPDRDGHFAALGERIAAVFTGLWGHVGVDFMLRGEDITILEINPRVTTSYAGLSRALGVNAAGLVLDLHRNGWLPDTIPNTGKPVILDW